MGLKIRYDEPAVSPLRVNDFIDDDNL